MNTTPISLSEVIKRVGSETPPFFRKIRIYAWIASIVIGSITTGIATAGIALPLWAVIVMASLGSACVTLAGASSLPTTDRSIIRQSDKNNSK
jgi:hypothetical protein